VVSPGEARVEVLDLPGPPEYWPAFAINRVGPPGPEYQLRPHAAAWRSLGDCVQGDAPAHTVEAKDIDAAALRKWTRFYGPLFSRARSVDVFGPGDMRLAAGLRDLARAWDPPGDDGLSRFRRGAERDHPIYAGRRWADFFLQPWPGRDEHILARHIVECARDQIEHGLSHRRCLGCGHWLVATRSDRLFCDNTCRIAARAGRGQRGRRSGSN
jgi:hypothetical protein